MSENDVTALLAFVITVGGALYRLYRALQDSKPEVKKERAQTNGNGNGNGNGNTYAAHRQTIDFLGKRQDDLIEELREFKREIRDEMRDNFRESKQDTKKRHDDFVELARRRDDGWILQFGDFSRRYREDSERRDAERKELQEQVSALKDDFSDLKAAFDELKDTINRRAA